MSDDANTNDANLTSSDGLGPALGQAARSSGQLPAADWLAQSVEQLKAIERLPDGWDSHGALRPRADIITGGRALLCSLARFLNVSRPHINPTRSGGVQFEWESGPRYLEIELTAPDRAEYYFEDRETRRHAEGVLYLGDSPTDEP